MITALLIWVGLSIPLGILIGTMIGKMNDTST